MQPAPKDPGMFGLKASQWKDLLSCDSTVRSALTYDDRTEAEQRKYKLNQIKRDELMYALRNRGSTTEQGKCYADFYKIQINFSTVAFL